MKNVLFIVFLVFAFSLNISSQGFYRTPAKQSKKTSSTNVPAAKKQPAHVFIGQWKKNFHDGNNGIFLDLYGKWQKTSF